MMKLALTLSMLATAVALVACGGGDDPQPTPTVATANTTANITASTVGAVAGQSFSFSSGISQFGTTDATTLDIPAGGSTFSVSSSQGTASGGLGFGSCIFTVTNSTFPATSPLHNGARLEITPCNIVVQTAGISVEAGPTGVPVTFNIGGSVSVAKNFTVDIDASGNVTVNNTATGRVATGTATGATGASGG